MAYIRIKRISGKQYAYEVKSIWTNKGPRQKVGKYLGPIIKLPEHQNTPFYDTFANAQQELSQKTFAQIISLAIHHTLIQRGFTEEKNQYKKDDVIVDKTTFSATNKNKKITLAINQGFLCEHSMKALLSYDGAADPSGKELATRIIGAGIASDDDLFFELFEKSHTNNSEAVTIEY